MAQWTDIKPEFNEECLLITAVSYRDQPYEYDVYIIAYVSSDEGRYMGWFDRNGEEYGDLADLKADMYLVLPLNPTATLPSYTLSDIQKASADAWDAAVTRFFWAGHQHKFDDPIPPTKEQYLKTFLK